MEVVDQIYRIQYKMILPEHESFNYWLNFGNDEHGYPTEGDARDYIDGFGRRCAASFGCPLIFRIFVIETRDIDTITIGDDSNE